MEIRVFSFMRLDKQQRDRVHLYEPKEYSYWQQKPRHSAGLYFVINDLNRWSL